ncbi:MAG TPA: phytanoyl-CoA dioxygenase family protein [Noviherbaspirillum sp.]|jgi:phytanoyl-CoA hydroxylase|uniref:phytanoyl-CoA dioxygenase family protein n=1 Tax=Noviherbaspirillum sp. TaxID=1926288 RepID=UPI002F93ABD1
MNADATLLPAARIDDFHRDGYLVLPGFAAPEAREAMLAVTRDHLGRALPPVEYEAELGYPGAPASLDAPGGRTVRRLRAAWQRDEAFRSWAADPALLARLRQLMGDRICLTLAHHNCVMTKHPGYGTATGWHRDIRYWSFMRNDLVSVWLALGSEREENGALKVIPGSHRLDVQAHRMDALDFLRPDLEENRALFAQGRVVELDPGDVLLFHSGLFHAAGRNDSDAVKYSAVFAYRAADNLPLPGSRSAAAGDVAL